MRKMWYGIGAVALISGAIACASDPATPTQSDIDKLDKQVSPVESTTTKAKDYITGGDWEVGKKDNYEAGVITPGTYIVTVADGGSHCYWKALKNFDNTLNSIIANDIIEPGSTSRVVVKSTYAGLSLGSDCVAKKKK